MTATHLAACDARAIRFALALPDSADLPYPSAEVLACLDLSHDVPVMIATAVLRGRLTRCPPDMRLTPKPWPKLPTAASVPVKKGRVSGDAVLATCTPNPKKPGSAARERYARYAIGLTKNQLRGLGLTLEDLLDDCEKGFITWAT